MDKHFKNYKFNFKFNRKPFNELSFEIFLNLNFI